MTRRTLAYGSYVRNDLTGFGADDASSLSLAEQMMLQLLATARIPSQTVTEWAQQSGDVSWQEVTALNNYQLFPITDQELVAVATATTAVPTTLAVLAPFLSFSSTLETAFEGTPYAYSLTEAIYAQADTAEPPRIYFLYWINLRPQADPKRGNTSLNFAASSIGGVLAYVHETPLSNSDRPSPKVSFKTALAQQSGQMPKAPAPVVVTGPTPTAPSIQAPIPARAPGQQVTPSPTTQASAGQSSKNVILVAAGAAAAYVGYQFFKSKRA